MYQLTFKLLSQERVKKKKSRYLIPSRSEKSRNEADGSCYYYCITKER